MAANHPLQTLGSTLVWPMAPTVFPDPASLSMQHGRDELILYLEELAKPDPRIVWAEESGRGLISGIDEVFHFFFDDNDFDETAVGTTLCNHGEVAAVGRLKASLEAILESVGEQGDDDDFVRHPLWPHVTAAAAGALIELRPTT